MRPRPHDIGELSLANSAHRLRLSVRPGLTGLWQVAARDDPLLSTRVHMDLSYVQNWSLWIDAMSGSFASSISMRTAAGPTFP